jgi:hypothetical protein
MSGIVDREPIVAKHNGQWRWNKPDLMSILHLEPSVSPRSGIIRVIEATINPGLGLVGSEARFLPLTRYAID